MNKRSSALAIRTLILAGVLPAAFFAVGVLIFSARSASAAPFVCTGEAFIIKSATAQLNTIDQTATPFVFTPIGLPAGYLVNNLGFRRSDGLLYAYRGDAPNQQVISIDDTGVATMLGSGGLPLPVGTAYNSGDVSADGTVMYFSADGQGVLHTISLPGLALIGTVVVPSDGRVLDWAAHPSNGLLYGGDKDGGEMAEVDPATGTRIDKLVLGGGIPPGADSYGAAWFDATETLFLYRNDGTIYEISGAETATPTLVSTVIGEISPAFNDGAACIQNLIGGAKQMTVSGPGLPTTVTIAYVVENFSAVETLSSISAIDDLTASFGTPGVDWTFTSISATPAAFVNPGFDGNLDTELINQPPTQSLLPLTSASITVVIQLLTTDAANMAGELCNQVILTGMDSGGLLFGDLSIDDPDPDPDGNGFPSEQGPSCIVPGTAPGLDLVKDGALDLGGDGVANPGDLINYTLTVTNTGGVTLTDVLVSDPMVSVITCPSGNPISTLLVAASEICTGSYAITQADIDAGQKDNTATADSNETPPVTDDHMEPILQAPTFAKVFTPDAILASGTSTLRFTIDNSARRRRASLSSTTCRRT